jgi:hypothetical protein
MPNIFSPLKKLLPFKKPIVIKRSMKTYITEQGWRLTYEKGEAQFEGWYRSKYGSYFGKIQNLASSRPSFFIKDPPKELDRHSHRVCFTERPNMGKGWYNVHFSIMPRDLDSGVLHIERTINESFGLDAKKTA